MLSFPPSVRIVLAAGVTDMRKSFDGLAAATREVIGEDPLSGHVFVFCNRRRIASSFSVGSQRLLGLREASGARDIRVARKQ